MGVQESIGTILRASADVPTQFDDDDVDGFPSLTYTDVGEVTEIPTFGGQADVVEHTPLKTGITEKFHGAINQGSLTVPLALARDDAGQGILRTAYRDRDRISFEIEYPDGSKDYFAGKVMSDVRRGSSVGAVVSGEVQIEIETEITEVAASA